MMQSVAEPKIVEKTWGMEEVIVNNDLYCGKRIFLRKNGCSSIHFHMLKTETFYVVSGLMLLQRWERNGRMVNTELNAGTSVTIEPGTPHRFFGLLEAEFYEFSSHHRDEDSIRITQSQMGAPLDLRRV